MKLGTVILVVILILITVTFAPVLISRLQKRRPLEAFSPSVAAADGTAVLQKVLHQAPDAAESTDKAVTLYLGGVASRSVILDVTDASMPLSAADVTDSTVRFVGDGSYDIVKSGGLLHSEFEIMPILKGTSGVLAYKGPDALTFLNARVNILNKLSAFQYVQLRSPGDTLLSHDLSQAAVPVVPEICKHAPMQAVSLSFKTGGTGTGGVSVFVLPHKNGLPPAAFHVRFYGNDVLIKYHVLKAAVGLEPNAIVTMSSAATSRSGGEIFLTDARAGKDPVTVYAELTRGHVRLCTMENSRKRSYYLKLPLLFSEESIFLSDSIDPPSVFTRTFNTEHTVIVPFAVGDLNAFDSVAQDYETQKNVVLPYVPTVTLSDS